MKHVKKFNEDVAWGQMGYSNIESEFCGYLEELVSDFESEITSERMQELLTKVINAVKRNPWKDKKNN